MVRCYSLGGVGSDFRKSAGKSQKPARWCDVYGQNGKGAKEFAVLL
jgi:hypothetical protein